MDSDIQNKLGFWVFWKGGIEQSVEWNKVFFNIFATYTKWIFEEGHKMMLRNFKKIMEKIWKEPYFNTDWVESRYPNNHDHM